MLPEMFFREMRWWCCEGWMTTFPVCRQLLVTSHTQSLESLNDSVVRTVFAKFSREIKTKFCTSFVPPASPLIGLWFHLGLILFSAYLLAFVTHTYSNKTNSGLTTN